MNNSSVLNVEDLVVEYDTKMGGLKAIDDVSLYINKREIFGLAGESGCGKSTLALALLRLLPGNGRIVKGKAYLNGVNIFQLENEALKKMRWKEISYIPQSALNAFDPLMRVGNQIKETLIEHGYSDKEDMSLHISKLFDSVGVPRKYLNSYPHELSGGMKQRALIALALVCQPSLMIADEPTTAVDVMVQRNIMNLFKKLQKKMNLSILLITHDLSVIAEICDRCAIIYAGKIVECADVFSLFDNPKHPYTKLLIESFPYLGSGKKIIGIEGRPPDLITPPSGCRFHPRCPLRKALNSPAICEKEEPILKKKKEYQISCHFVN